MSEPKHWHLPSVHIRQDGSGYDYEEDLFGRGAVLERIITLKLIDHGQMVEQRVTREILCEEDRAYLRTNLPLLMKRGDPDAVENMRQRAEFEYARQLRILSGEERACLGCGCSETRSCSGGCIWATPTVCSRCMRTAV